MTTKKLWLEVSTGGGTVIKGHGIRMVENHWCTVCKIIRSRVDGVWLNNLDRLNTANLCTQGLLTV